MKFVEVALVATFALLGVRSLVYWLRRPFASTDLIDQLLFSLYLTGRIGMWFALAGFFAIVASIGTSGRPFRDEFARFGWYIVVFLTLAALQFVAGFILGRRSPPEAGGTNPRP